MITNSHAPSLGQLGKENTVRLPKYKQPIKGYKSSHCRKNEHPQCASLKCDCYCHRKESHA